MKLAVVYSSCERTLPLAVNEIICKDFKTDVKGSQTPHLALDKIKRKNLPRYTSGSTQLEHIDFLKASMNLFGYLDVTATNVRPATVGGKTGTQFGLTGQYPNGLNLQGDSLMVESEKGLNIVLYVAPAHHYYNKYKADADAIMTSMTFN